MNSRGRLEKTKDEVNPHRVLDPRELRMENVLILIAERIFPKTRVVGVEVPVEVEAVLVALGEIAVPVVVAMNGSLRGIAGAEITFYNKLGTNALSTRDNCFLSFRKSAISSARIKLHPKS